MSALKNTLLIPIALVLSVAGLGACAAPATSPQGEGEGNKGATVAVVNIAFDPATLEVAVGDTVTWTNEDSGVRHTVTSGKPAGDGVPGVSEGSAARPDGTFNGDLADAGATFAFTFEDAGTYAYFCDVHPSMTARIVVR